MYPVGFSKSDGLTPGCTSSSSVFAKGCSRPVRILLGMLDAHDEAFEVPGGVDRHDVARRQLHPVDVARMEPMDGVADLGDRVPGAEPVRVSGRVELGFERVPRHDFVPGPHAVSKSFFVPGRNCHTVCRSGRAILMSRDPSIEPSTRRFSPRTKIS